MKRLIFTVLTCFTVVLTSCQKDDESISKETQFPVFTMSGPRYMSMVKGEAYIEQGVTAKEGETELSVTVVGEVDADTEGLYTIEYKAQNKDGYSNTVKRLVAVLPGPEEAGVDISGTYNYATGGGSAQITKLAPGFYLASNVYSPASVMPAYLITVDGNSIVLPQSSLSVYGPLKGTATLSSAGALVYKVDVLNYGITGSTRNWIK